MSKSKTTKAFGANADKKLWKVDIWHNIVWPKYKGEVFSSLHEQTKNENFSFKFFQIAQTANDRVGIYGVDLKHHRYPYTLLFKSTFEETSTTQRLRTILKHSINSDADLSILINYHKIETWIQMAVLKFKGQKVALFCDSTTNDQPQHVIKGILKRIIFSAADGVFAYGTRTKEYVMSYGVKQENIFHPCQTAALPDDYNTEKALQERIIQINTNESPRFLYVGRLSLEKGVDVLLHSFVKVRKKHETAKLIIVGSGPQEKSLKEISQNLGIEDTVTFTGSKSNKALFEEYSRATCFILPSRSEPWGLVVNESLAYGCPVVVSETCGCVPELVVDGQTGFVHKVDDVDDLASKMLRIVDDFSDIKKIAPMCITHMKKYTPTTAAQTIANGARALLEKGVK